MDSSSIQNDTGTGSKRRKLTGNEGKVRDFSTLEAEKGMKREKDSKYREQTILEKEREGVEIAKKLCELGDKKIQTFLTTTTDGAKLQGVLLGLKSRARTLAFRRHGVDQSLVKLLREHAGEDFVVTEHPHFPGSFAVTSISGIKEHINQHPELFPDYTSESSIDSHLLNALESPSSREKGLSISQWRARDGFLFGIPSDDVEAYTKFNEYRLQFTNLARKIHEGRELQPTDSKTDLSESDKILLGQFYEVSRFEEDAKDLDSALELDRKRDEAHERFLDKNRGELTAIINKCFRDMPEDAKRYCIESRGVSLRGFQYIAANPYSEESKAFRKRVNDTFERSGI